MWALANGEPHYVGITVHKLDPGIDSGDIYLTRQTQVLENDTPSTLDCRNMRNGIDSYGEVISALALGKRFNPVSQLDIGSGRTFLGNQWNIIKLIRAYKYWRTGQLKHWVSQQATKNKVRTVNVLAPVDSGIHDTPSNKCTFDDKG